MALPRAGRPASALSSVTFQLALHVTSAYFVFYFVFTLGLIIRKSLVLSYPTDALAGDVTLLLLLAALDAVHFICGVKGNLSDSQGYVVANLVATACAILLTVYFLAWQTYVMRLDVIISSVLVVAFGLDGLLAICAFTQLANIYS